MNKSESKYFNTAVKMDKAFLELLEKKDFEFITVKEICVKAGVNRSTFYLHYETIGDLLDESVQYMFDQLFEYFPDKDTHVMNDIKNAELADLYLITPHFLEPYMTYISEHKRLFATALKKSDSLRLDDSYDKLFTHVLSRILDRFGIPENRKKYMLKFYIYGIIAVIGEWLKNDCAEPIDFIIEIISEQIPKIKEDI
ncbi:MAG: TetR/AcrR family transcriptional regulator [Ruminococcus sp.]|nr:TetR/AcrR family transcriptional regulator [Ruminococcus sp.]